MHRVPTSDDRLAHAFNTLANGASLNLLNRYEGTLSRSYARAFKQLQLLRSLRIRVQPNEPKAEFARGEFTRWSRRPIPANKVPPMTLPATPARSPNPPAP